MKAKILAVFRHPEARTLATTALAGEYEVTAVDAGAAALESVRSYDYAVVVTNDTLPDMTGEELATRVRSQSPSSHVVIAATPESAESAIKLLGPGGFTYVEKPLSAARIRHAVTVALERVRLSEENTALRVRLQRFDSSSAPFPGAVEWSLVQRVFRFGSVRDMERLMILNRLAENNQNRTRSAESLEISVRTLRNKLHEYNVPAKANARSEDADAVLV